MRNQIGNRIKSYSMMIVLPSLLVFLVSSWAYAAQGHLSVGTPHIVGPSATVDVYVHFPGVFPAGADSNGNLLVKGIKIKQGDSDAIKAGKIAAAINFQFNGTIVATVSATAGGGHQVDLSYNKNGTLIAGNAWIPARGDRTGEGAALASLDFQPPGSGLTGMIGYDTGLSGVDVNGNMSTFTAEIGYAGLDDTVNLAFNQLSAPTLDALTLDMYTNLLAGLPSQLQPDLHLDLANDNISFNFPLGQSNYFAGALSTDSLVETSGGLASTTPEPTSLLLLGSGLLGLGGAFRRRLRARGEGTPLSHPL